MEDSSKLIRPLVTQDGDKGAIKLFKAKQLFESLEPIEDDTDVEAYIHNIPRKHSWCLLLFKKLAALSKFNQTVKQDFKVILESWRREFHALLVRFATKDDHQVVSKLQEYTTYEFRWYFSKLMLFPVGLGEGFENFDFTVDSSKILEDSFTQLSDADPILFHGKLSPHFKDEEAVGEGVLREWFDLLLEKLFDKSRNLFITSPNDSRRYSPCPQSYDEDDLQYFKFCGRLIALALRYGLQIGILFDPLFFGQLAGVELSWEDVKETDRAMYDSFKNIMDMDTLKFSNEDGLGLTFSVDFQEKSGEIKSYTLLTNGEQVRVNSYNREKYIELKFEHCYVTRVQKQIESFLLGFKEMLSVGTEASSFFSCLELRDLDYMLRGSEEDTISVDQWKQFTVYNGYEETDDVITWFWEVVTAMDHEKQRNLLYFWTAVRYLPRNGFSDLPKKPQICKSQQYDHGGGDYPTSNTCFYQLRLPPYETFDVTLEKVSYITHKDVSTSFGRP